MPRLTKADKASRVTITEANRRKALALAELREMERDERRGALLPAQEVRRVWADRLAALKDRVLMLPDRLAARLANRAEVDVRMILRDELEQCLRGIHADAQGG